MPVLKEMMNLVGGQTIQSEKNMRKSQWNPFPQTFVEDHPGPTNPSFWCCFGEYGLFTYIRVVFGVNVGKYTIH